MNLAHAHEMNRLQAIIDRQERELDHRAEVISEQADRIAARDLTITAMRLGRGGSANAAEGAA